MEKTVTFQGKEMKLLANALLPRKYRHTFGRDLMQDMQKIAVPDSEGAAPDMDLSVFEDLTWLMFKNAGEDVGNSPEEWLSGIDDMFSVYMLIPDVVGLWQANNETTSVPAKK